MYGISNSQQQGGGGGSAASYKAIKASIAPSDWQEVAKQAFFVGENAMTWTVNEYGEHEKSQTTKLGLVSGNSYTITAVCDGQTYTQTAVAGDEVDGIVISYELSPNMFVDIYDDSTGSGCAIEVEATSFVITSFTGIDFGSSGKATISDSAIKVNSAVTMYTNTSEKIAAGEKTNGSITLTAPSVPNAVISYSLEIVGTDTEGLFEIVNGYVPEIPDTPSGVPQWNTIYEDTTGAGVDSIDLTAPLKGGELYRITINGEFYIFCPDEDGGTAIQDIGIVYETLHGGNSSLTHTTINLTHTKTRLSLAYAAQYNITEAGISNYVFSTASGLKFTKLEVYR